MRRTLARVAVALGAVGLAACAAGAVAVWPLGARVFGRAAAVAARTDEVLTSADQRLGRWGARLDLVREELHRFRAAARDLAGNPGKSEPEDRERVERLVTEIEAALAKAEAAADAAASGAEAVRHGTRVFGTLTARRAGAPGRAETARRVETLVEILGRTADTLRGLGDRLAAIRRDKGPRDVAAALADLAGEVGAVVDTLRLRVVETRDTVGDARREVAAVRESVAFWEWAGPALVTAACVWAGIGQWFLAARGLAALRGRNARGV